MKKTPNAERRTSNAELQRKLDNAGARSHLTEAAAFIARANRMWPFPHAAGLIETLQQLKAKIKNEIRDTRSGVRDSASHPASRISDLAPR